MVSRTTAALSAAALVAREQLCELRGALDEAKSAVGSGKEIPQSLIRLYYAAVGLASIARTLASLAEQAVREAELRERDVARLVDDRMTIEAELDRVDEARKNMERDE